MLEGIFSLIFIFGMLYFAGRSVVHAFCNPRGAYLRIIGGSIAAMAAAVLLIVVLDFYSNDAAGLGLVFIFFMLIAMILVVTGLALVATTLRHILDRLR
jgi:hypothetical protein